MPSSLRLLFTYIGVVVVHSAQPSSTTISPGRNTPPALLSSNGARTTATSIAVLVPASTDSPRILGFRIDSDRTEFKTVDGKERVEIPPDKLTHVHLYGKNLTAIDRIEVVAGECGVKNTSHEKSISHAGFKYRNENRILLSTTFPVGDFSICPHYGGVLAHLDDGSISITAHAESTDKVYKLYFLWLEILVLVLLHLLSAFFSGLSLGLMTLTVRELEIIAKCGSEKEQEYATAILPLRRKGNQLLCTLLLGNTICNASISILIDDLLPSNLVIPVATTTMLLFGEILPQSICVNNALATGARMLFFAKFCMVCFAIFAWPISKLLDCIVGEEHESYDRKRLMELMNFAIANVSEGGEESCEGGGAGPRAIRNHINRELHQLWAQNQSTGEDDELKIAVGAMNLKGKVIFDSMTPIGDVFMLPETANLNSSAIAAIVRAGYTRIPVFRKGNKMDICDVLITKDLALIDPDDNYTVRMLCNINKRPIPRMPHDTTLFKALQIFRKGDDGHLAIVCEGDEIIGIITLEDVVEEILQEEIKDEFDLKREKRGHEKILWDTTAPPAVMGKQLQTVTYQFCVANEEAFAERLIDKTIFLRLMASCTKHVDVTHLKPLGGALTVPLKQLPRCARLYHKDEMSDRYILILEGRAEVTIGQGGMKFEAGPFHRFGQELLQKLMKHADELCKESSTVDSKQLMHFKPDFTVAVYEDCIFLEVTSDMYIRALRTTRIQRERGSNGPLIPNFKSPGMSLEPSPSRLPLMGLSKEKMPPSREEVKKAAESPKSPATTAATPTETESGRAEGNK